MSITLDANLVINALKQQRNEALDSAAMLAARASELQKQVSELTSKLAEATKPEGSV